MELIISIISLVIAIGAFIHIEIQTENFKEQTKNLKNDVRINALNHVTDGRISVNLALLQDEEMCNALNVTRQEILMFMVMNNKESWYLLMKDEIINNSDFDPARSTIQKHMRNPVMLELWGRNKHEFHPEYRAFVDDVIQKM